MIFDLLTPPQGPRGEFNVARPIHVSGCISSNGLGGDSTMDRQTDRRMEAITISPKAWGKIDKTQLKTMVGIYNAAETGAMKLV